MASCWLQNRCVFRRYDGCVSHIHVQDQHSLPCSLHDLLFYFKMGGGKSGKVKFTVGVLQIWLPCTIMPGSMTFLSLKSMSHV